MTVGKNDVSAILGTRKNVGEYLGTGGGYIANNQPQAGNVFDADPNRKYVDLSGVSTFCSPQRDYA